MPFIATERPRLVDEVPGRYRRPASGGYLARSLDCVNWAALWKARPGFLHRVRWSELDVEALLDATPIGLDRTADIRWRATDAAQAVFIWLTYQATRRTRTLSEIVHIETGVYVIAELFDAGDMLIDACVWSHSAGSLVVSDGPRGQRHPIRHVSTGKAINPTPAVVPSRPRPLNVGSAAGGELRMRLTMHNVRVGDVFIQECPHDLV